MATFFTKKQKAQMRQRRKRKQRAESEKKKENADEPEQQHIVTTVSSPLASSASAKETAAQAPIVIPAHLSGKEARKYRKDARRKARAEGHDASALVFVNERNETLDQDRNDNDDDDDEQQPPRKRKKVFPRINDILKQQKEEAQRKLQEQERRKQEEMVPEDVKAKYVAMDCEMVGIGSDGKQSALARVSLTGWYGNVVLDTFVQVPSRVTDFRTFVSGVTPKDIATRNAMNVVDCRKRVAELLRGKILVGHALKNDLHALLLSHPKEHIRDTAKYRPFQRASGRNGGKWRPRKLRDLVKEHLNLTIQVPGEAHDSTQDARATMDLFKRVRIPWEKELENAARKKNK